MSHATLEARPRMDRRFVFWPSMHTAEMLTVKNRTQGARVKAMPFLVQRVRLLTPMLPCQEQGYLSVNQMLERRPCDPSLRVPISSRQGPTTAPLLECIQRSRHAARLCAMPLASATCAGLVQTVPGTLSKMMRCSNVPRILATALATYLKRYQDDRQSLMPFPALPSDHDSGSLQKKPSGNAVCICIV